MPTVPLTQLPKSRSEEEFESICADVLNMMYNTTFVPYGRHGQKQNGIDLFDSSVQSSHIVAQCKNYYACTYEKLREQIEKDIYSAGNLPFPIHTFIAMTSLDRDVTTQNIILTRINRKSFAFPPLFEYNKEKSWRMCLCYLRINMLTKYMVRLPVMTV